MNDYHENVVVCDVNIELSAPLDETKVLELFWKLRRVLSGHGITDFSHDREKESLRLGTGQGKALADERIVRLSKRTDLAIAWGTRTPLSEATKICLSVAQKFAQALASPLLIQYFSCQLHFEVPSTGNTHERIAGLAYSKQTIGKFAEAMTKKHPKFSLTDADVDIKFLIDESTLGALKIRGSTTPAEILQNNFDNDPLRLLFGLRKTNTSSTGKELAHALDKHIQLVHSLSREVFVPALLKQEA